MPSTYVYNEPSGGVFGDLISNVRFLANDRTPAAPYSLSDAEIQYLLIQENSNIKRAAADTAYQMAQNYAKQATTSKSVGDLSMAKHYDGVADAYLHLADDLRTGGAGTGVSPFYSGTTCPTFTLGMNDYDGTGTWQ